ncbi:MAG: nuclear transport factor 2 family protein [Burkholderiales bacterium]
MQELIELEKQGWCALSMEGDDGRKFYASVLRDDAVMLFPGGMRIEGRDRILQSLGSQPWESFRIEDAHVIALTSNAATLVYKATAKRKGGAQYVALISSTYVRDRTWQLVVHQQTPE